MTGAPTVPTNPKIYHITHVNNLARIIAAGALWSDAKCAELGLDCDKVGMSSIKQRRLALPVTCHPPTTVGQYVPFYFCPRSVMLFILHCGNHPEVTYRGGQHPIVHLEIDTQAMINWASANHRKWAFTDRNAGAYYTQFYNDPAQLSVINWNAVQAADFRDSQIKDGKQAEFLCYESVPFGLVSKIGVHNEAIRQQVADVIGTSSHTPTIHIEKPWYF